MRYAALLAALLAVLLLALPAAAQEAEVVYPGGVATPVERVYGYPAGVPALLYERGAGAATFAGQLNPTGDPIGGYTGYSSIMTEAEALAGAADYVIDEVDDAAALAALLALMEQHHDIASTSGCALTNTVTPGSPATSGEVIWIHPDHAIDISGKRLEIGAGVTVASDRGSGGSLGAMIYSDQIFDAAGTSTCDHMIEAQGANVAFTGLRLRGPWVTGGPSSGNGIGILSTAAGGLSVTNSELTKWPHAAIFTVTDSVTVAHNAIYDNGRDTGFGYGTWFVGHNASDNVDPTFVSEASPGDCAVVEGNWFTDNRHHIASGGGRTSCIIKRYNYAGPPRDNNHQFDNHKAGFARVMHHNLFYRRSSGPSTAVNYGGMDSPPHLANEFYANWTDWTGLGDVDVARQEGAFPHATARSYQPSAGVAPPELPYAVVGIDAANDTFTLNADLSPVVASSGQQEPDTDRLRLVAGETFTVSGSAAHDGTYTVATTVATAANVYLNDANTVTVEVVEDLTGTLTLSDCYDDAPDLVQKDCDGGAYVPWRSVTTPANEFGAVAYDLPASVVLPVAGVSVSPSEILEGESATWTATCTDADGHPVAHYLWTLEDGSTLWQTSNEVVRTFASPGSYTVSVVCFNDYGVSSDVTVAPSASVTVQASNPYLADLGAAWPMGEASGTRVDAHSVNDLAVVVATSSATGKVGDGADFRPGGKLALANASAGGLMVGTDDLTVSFWLYVDALPVTGYASVIEFGAGNTTGEPGYRFHLRDSGRLYFWVSDGAARVAMYGNVAAGNWYWVEAAWDRDGNATIRLNDAVPAGSPTQSVVAWDETINATFTDDFTVGQGDLAAADVIVDELYVYHRLFDAADRSRHYNAGLGRAYADL